jgi:hypothetical protein
MMSGNRKSTLILTFSQREKEFSFFSLSFWERAGVRVLS